MFANKPAACPIFALAAALALAACAKPKAPEQDVPPDPKSANAATTPAQTPTDLNQAIQQPIDEAKAVREATEEAANAQRQAIDAATSE